MANENDIYVPQSKLANNTYPIPAEMQNRWSPYVFDSKPVATDLIAQCFDAARWTASSYNEQPWFFLVAFREQTAEFQKMIDCLVEPNQAWAKFASVLILSATSPTFARNGKPNAVHQHDLGQAAAHFAMQATVLGLSVHQMSGIVPEKVIETFKIPDGFVPQTAIAVGYATPTPQPGQESLIERDEAPRSRKAIADFVFQGTWDNSWKA